MEWIAVYFMWLEFKFGMEDNPLISVYESDWEIRYAYEADENGIVFYGECIQIQDIYKPSRHYQADARY